MPVEANANFSSTVNMYDYKPANLLILYGVTLISTLVALLVGVFSFWRNGISFDNSVSTIGASMLNTEVGILSSTYIQISRPSLSMESSANCQTNQLILHSQMAEVLQNKYFGASSYDPQVMKVRLRLGAYSIRDKDEGESVYAERLGFIPYDS